MTPMSIFSTPPSIATTRPWFRRFLCGRARFVGIDIGVDQVRCATFGVNRESTVASEASELRWLSQTEFTVPVDPKLPPPPDWVEIVVEQLRTRLPRCVDGEQINAVVSLPVPWIHYETCVDSELEVRQTQCDAMFSASIFQSNAHLTSWPIAADKEHCVVAATAESAACRVAEVITDIGYRVSAILPHGVALLRAASALTSLEPSIALLLDMSGGLVAVGNGSGCGLCRNLPACDPNSQEPIYLEQMEPWLQEIASELNATCRYAARSGKSLDPETPVLISGDAAMVPGVDVAIATMSGRPVATWQAANAMRLPHRPPSDDPALAVSHSLAYCGFRNSESHWRRDR